MSAGAAGDSERPAARARRSFPFPIPNGWFLVAYSDEIAPGEVRPLRYFGRELVLFRGASGGRVEGDTPAARVFDAWCPHLGAHLGHGGRVEGDTLRCPFHAWRFDASGSCVEIPYAQRIPARAQLRAWRTLERHGMVFVWYHGAGAEPDFEVPEIAAFADPDWTEPIRRDWIVRSRQQELAENTVDQAHFKYVHKTNSLADTEIRPDGPVLRVVSKSFVQTPRGEQEGRIEIHCHGLGVGWTRFTGVVETLVVTCGTAIDDERVHMRLQLLVRKLGNQDATRGVGRAFVQEIERQFAEDIPIWENKAHWEEPLLCDGDGPIGILRRWARQFYASGPGDAARG